MNSIMTSFTIIIAVLIGVTLGASIDSKNKLLVFMIDGCRWDYFSRTPGADTNAGFQIIKEKGVIVEYVQSIFPSLSYPSWTTIATGVYPEHHGIVGNNFYDKVTGLIFESSNDSFTGNPKWWQNHTPIWTTLTHQGIRTSLHRWSRCDIPFNIDDQEILPLKCEPNLKSDGFHSSNETLKEAFKEALDSFKNDTIDAAFIYYPNIDHLGHDHGPNSIEIKDEIEMIDDIIKDVIDNFGDKVNFVIVSDHGMSDSADKTFEKLTDYVDDVNDIAIIVDRFAFSHIGVKDPTKIDQIYDSLQVWDGMNVYKKADIPDSLHFREHPLILDILLVSNGSIMIGRDNANQDLYLPIADGDESQEAQRQDSHHGFNDLSNGYESQGTFPDMRSAFLAIGPAFKANHTHPWIKLVDEYQIFLHVLKVQGGNADHAGDWNRVKDMFIVEDVNLASKSRSSLNVVVLMTIMSVIMMSK